MAYLMLIEDIFFEVHFELKYQTIRKVNLTNINLPLSLSSSKNVTI